MTFRSDIQYITHFKIIIMNLDVEDYLDEASERTLIAELNRRGYDLIEKKKVTKDKDEYILPEFKTREELKKFLYQAMGIREWHNKERLISEINELF